MEWALAIGGSAVLVAVSTTIMALSRLLWQRASYEPFMRAAITDILELRSEVRRLARLQRSYADLATLVDELAQAEEERVHNAKVEAEKDKLRAEGAQMLQSYQAQFGRPSEFLEEALNHAPVEAGPAPIPPTLDDLPFKFKFDPPDPMEVQETEFGPPHVGGY